MTLTPAKIHDSINVVIIRSSSIGDVVLATACLHFLVAQKANFRVFWIGRSPSLDLLQESFKELIPLKLPQSPDELDELVKTLGRVDLVCDLQTNMRSYKIAKKIARTYGAKISRARKNSWQRACFVFAARLWGRTRTKKITGSSKKQFEMMLGALRDGLNSLHMGELPRERSTPLLPLQDVAKKKRFLLAIAPGASYETKKAPSSVFVDIIRNVKGLLSEEVFVQFFGDKNDERAVTEILSHFGTSLAHASFAGKLTLAETAEKLSSCSVLLSNDSSLCHIAEAVGTDVGVLFGPTSEEFGFVPWRDGSRAFSLPLGCRPCSKHGKTPCRYGDKQCFNGLNTKDISQFLIQRLESEVR